MASGTPLRVGTLNVRNASLPLVSGIRPWSKRRSVAVAEILNQGIDVLGIQEASYGLHTGVRYASGGSTQYFDLLKGLNAAGGHYALSSTAQYNCQRSTTPYNCKYDALGASNGERILYDADRLTLVSKGAEKYASQQGSDRYAVWAKLKLKSNGHAFLFLTTHLTGGVRLAQWEQLIPIISKVNTDHLPVVVTGDFNARKTEPVTQTTLPDMKAAGYGDVLNQKYMVNPIVNPRARQMVNGWVNSFNGGRRNVADFGFEKLRKQSGNGIDYVFASNSLVVDQWKVVVRYNPTTLHVRGMFPSDHNLVRAIVKLP